MELHTFIEMGLDDGAGIACVVIVGPEGRDTVTGRVRPCGGGADE
jgi:hypothetical protein